MDSLLPLNTFSVGVYGTATATKTLVKHVFRKKSSLGTKVVKARGSLAYDEAFCVVKDFLEKSSLRTIEEIQSFGNNYLPSPYWIRVIRVVIPLSTRLEANKVLIDTIGEKEIDEVVGGRQWWQCTAHRENGIDGEWISMKRDWEGLGKAGPGGKRGGKSEEELEREQVKELKRRAKEREDKRWKEGKEENEKREKDDEGVSGPWVDADGEGEHHTPKPSPEGASGEDVYEEDLDEMRCLLYIHGGAYFWGSINSHRYVIWRLARKVGGRAFSINYRLAPQYPFPCGLADALAAYLYLIRPPPGAKHRPVDPAKITLAGDSAGGGLVLALLCLIRDSGVPAPAGAMLISPWCDLTHSMPSILENTETDIVPAYGFLFKPSTLWPPPDSDFLARAKESTSIDGLKKSAQEFTKGSGSGSSKHHHLLGHHGPGERKKEELAERVLDATGGEEPKAAEGDHANGASPEEDGQGQSKAEPARKIKVKIDGVEVELKDQIQCYATNEQLAYPFVSPAWQPSLGGLPPLYVMCGDKEVLRDEIVYMAHRAAHPDQFPIRQAMLDFNKDRTEKTKDLPPTKVHLQIYDDACHDLPLFSFLHQAKFVYRAMAAFGKFVTTDQVNHRVANDLNNNDSTPSIPQQKDKIKTQHDAVAVPKTDATGHDEGHAPGEPSIDPPAGRAAGEPAKLKRTRSLFGTLRRKPAAPNEPVPELPNGNGHALSPSSSSSRAGSAAGGGGTRATVGLEQTIYTALEPFRRPPFVDNMVRERVGIDGVVRPMEGIEKMPIFKLSPDDMGLIKEAPAKRYIAGKKIWDKRFHKTAIKVAQKREYHLRKSIREEALRLDAHFQKLSTEDKGKGKGTDGAPLPAGQDAPKGRRTDSPEPVEAEAGLWRLDGERPPPSSIAARKDTREARKLARLMDEQFSRMSAMNIFSEVHKVATSASGPGGRGQSL